MIEKKKWMEENYDKVRTALMFEPRGHHDMFGAFLCEPVNPEADFGVTVSYTHLFLNYKQLNFVLSTPFFVYLAQFKCYVFHIFVAIFTYLQFPQ